MMNKVIVFMVVLFSVGIVACGDKNNNSESSDFGEINVKVTGEIESDFSGIADFSHLLLGNVESWEITGHNYNPQTFSINFSKMMVGGTAERPSPGTYSIGNTGIADYTANLITIADEDFMNAHEYSTSFGNTLDKGTLTVTSSNENIVKGRFEFTASRVDDNLNIKGTVRVTGEFTTNKRIN